MSKLIVVIMGPGKKHFAEMCLESVKDADEILYWTSANTINFDYTVTINPHKLKINSNGWDENDKATNGKCRQRYLDYLKKNYPDDWCLILDEDEILEEGGIKKIKKLIEEETPCIFNVKMRHFINNLGHEDNLNPEHWVPNRLFHISLAKFYPLHSHPILNNEQTHNNYDETTIWHLGHLPVDYMDYIKKRYEQHASDSVIHNQEFLKWWKNAHLFGKYPIKEINPVELPQIICNRYDIDKDEFYFNNRGIEVKHFIDVYNYIKFFNLKNE